jgi:hypothetical protein
LVVALLAVVSDARAGEQTWQSERAKQLFETAMDLVDRGKHGLACPMLAESLSLDAGMGTKYYLARCYEQIGRLATAHRLLVQVAAEARAAGRRDRARHAARAATALEPKVPSLTVIVPAELRRSSTLLITRDGQPLRRDQWGKAVPIDLGEHEILARQPGSRLAWSHKVWLAQEGEDAEVEVPLIDSLRAPAAAAAASGDGEVSPHRSTLDGDETDDGVDGLLLGGVASLVAAGASAAVLLWAALEVDSIRSDPAFDRYRSRFTDDQDACEQADAGVEFPEDLGAMSAADAADACAKASTFSTVQIVTGITSVAFTGLGIALLAMRPSTDDDDELADLNLTLHGGDHFSGVVLRGRF